MEAQNLSNNVSLSSGQRRTFEIVYYILNMGYDQTEEDANKKFGAGIRVDSVATGQYKVLNYGENCWDTQLVSGTENEYKLTVFHGIDNNEFLISDPTEKNPDYGKVREECIYNGNPDPSNGGVIYNESDDSYSVTIPSDFGGRKITTVGNNLFNSINPSLSSLNRYTRIKKITINDGITTIEDGIRDDFISPFAYVGVSVDMNTGDTTPNFAEGVKVKLPNSLETIGAHAFKYSDIKQLNIPFSVVRVNNHAFNENNNLTNLKFLTDENGESNLEYIGDSAFKNCDITTDIDNPLVIPKSVKTIDDRAFQMNYNLTKLVFSVDSLENSNLQTIGNDAFYSCNLSYGANNDYLIIPKSVSSVGHDAFRGNNNLTHIKYLGTTNLGNNWYGSGVLYETPEIN